MYISYESIGACKPSQPTKILDFEKQNIACKMSESKKNTIVENGKRHGNKQ